MNYLFLIILFFIPFFKVFAVVPPDFPSGSISSPVSLHFTDLNNYPTEDGYNCSEAPNFWQINLYNGNNLLGSSAINNISVNEYLGAINFSSSVTMIEVA